MSPPTCSVVLTVQVYLVECAISSTVVLAAPRGCVMCDTYLIPFTQVILSGAMISVCCFEDPVRSK